MTQEQIALSYMNTYGSIGRPEAFSEGIANITAVIAELRKKGTPVLTERIKYVNGKGQKKIKSVWKLEREKNDDKR